MKKYSSIFILILLLLSGYTNGQVNTPNNAGLPTGGGSGRMTYPLNFNQSPNVAPVSTTYISSFYPLYRVGAVDFTPTPYILSNTVYNNGWGQPVLSVSFNGSGNDIAVPFEHRTSDTAMAFPAYPAPSGSGFINDPFSKQKTYYSNTYPKESDNAYGASSSDNISGVANAKDFLPGRALVGNAKGVTTSTNYNVASDIYLLTYSSGNICKSGTYAANALSEVTSAGQHNQVVKTYTDMSGKLICRKVKADASTWLTTYYMYDDLDRLTFILPPKASAQLVSNTCLSNMNDLVFKYNYDKYGNVVNKFVPGRNDTDVVVYNRQFRPVLYQTPGLRDSTRFRFVIYDKLGRTVMTGVYTGNEDLEYWRGVTAGTRSKANRLIGGVPVPDTSTLEYWLLNDFTGSKYPSSLFGCDIYSYNYYDDYANSPVSGTFSTAFTASYATGANNDTPAVYTNVQGKLVASRVKILTRGQNNNFTNTPWVTNLYFYDEKSRLIQQQTKNPWNNWDTVTMQYNWPGQLVRKISCYHLWSSATKPNTKISTGYEYSFTTGRLISVKQKIDTFATELISYNEYDSLGRLSKKSICETEEQIYTYNVRGQLDGINKKTLRDTALPTTMTFAEELNYETGFDSLRFDGSLSGYKWRSKSSNPSAYGYRYDMAGRMIAADYRDSTASYGWDNGDRDFTVTDLSYDLNGNIQGMKQWGYDNTYTPAIIDNLTYSYNNGNKLTKITDAGVASPEADFDNGSSGTSNDYTYDNNGNLITDANKAISLQYDDLDMPTRVTNGSDSIINIYDAGGVLLQKHSKEGGNDINYRYWGPLVFKNDTLQYVMNAEGRNRWQKDSLHFKTDIFVRDHQGNVRTVVSKDISTGLNLHAGFEMAARTTEETVFSQISPIVDNNPTGAPGDLLSGYLDGTNNSIGTAIVLQVMAGDQVDLKSYGYYDNPDPKKMNTFAKPSNMLSALVTSLTSGTLYAGDGGLVSSTTVNGLLSSANYALYDAMKNSITDANYPRVYLNYLVFDGEMNFVPSLSKVTQLTVPSKQWGTMTNPQTTGEISGWVVMYVSNESQTPTWIDNTYIEVIKGRLQQEQHYYPHGLQVDLGVASGFSKNQYSFEGNELQTQSSMQLSDFNFRQYDQQIGRFTAIDPLADEEGQEILSPYHFVGNDPANFTDPFGLETGCTKPWGYGAGVGGNGNRFGAFVRTVINSACDGVSAAIEWVGEISTGGGGSPVNAMVPDAAVLGIAPVGGKAGGGGGGGAAGGAGGGAVAKVKAPRWISSEERAGQQWLDDGRKMAVTNSPDHMSKGKLALNASGSGGIVTLDHVQYDLPSFNKFYDMNSHVKAYGYTSSSPDFNGKIREHHTSFTNKSDFKLNNMSFVPYAEVSGDLVLRGNTVTATGIIGHSYGDLTISPYNPGTAQIHTHPPTGQISYYDPGNAIIKHPSIDIYPGPSPEDVNKSGYTYFSVIVNDRYIYLYRKDGEVHTYSRKDFSEIK